MDPATAALAIAGAVDAVGESIEHGQQIYQAAKGGYEYVQQGIKKYFPSKKRTRKGDHKMSQKMDVVGGGIPVKKSQLRLSSVMIGKDQQIIRVVGNPDDCKEDGFVRFPAVSGWKFDGRDWRYSRINYSPLTITQGDLFATSSTSSGSPNDWCNIYGSSVHSGDTAGRYNFFNNLCSFGKQVVTTSPDVFAAWGANECISTGSDYYADLCIPVFPIHAYGRIDVGSTNSNLPFGALDCFEKFKDGATTSGSMFDYTVEQMGANPYSLYMNAAAPVYDLGMYGSITSNNTQIQQCFVMVDTEFILNNSAAQSQTFEIYQCLPRKPTGSSPISDLSASYYNNEETNSGRDATPLGFVRIGEDPRKFHHMRTTWKLNKRVVTLAGGASLKIKMRVPLSKLSYDTLKKLQHGSEAPISSPGLSQWLWIRSYGIHGFDPDSKLMGHNGSRYAISMYQKVKVWHCKPRISKRLDLVNYGTSSSVALSADEQNAVQDNTTNPQGSS